MPQFINSKDFKKVESDCEIQFDNTIFTIKKIIKKSENPFSNKMILSNGGVDYLNHSISSNYLYIMEIDYNLLKDFVNQKISMNRYIWESLKDGCGYYKFNARLYNIKMEEGKTIMFSNYRVVKYNFETIPSYIMLLPNELKTEIENKYNNGRDLKEISDSVRYDIVSNSDYYKYFYDDDFKKYINRKINLDSLLNE